MRSERRQFNHVIRIATYENEHTKQQKQQHEIMERDRKAVEKLAKSKTEMDNW